MKIYKSEAGLDLSNNKVAYAACLKPSTREFKTVDIAKAESLTKVSNPILYPLESILVTTSWNRNDDVFPAKEVWMARNTPEDTPFNMEHNQKQIIGHITGNHVIDDDYNIIEDETNVPDYYHILTSSVIYKSWEDKEYEKSIATIIDEIERGEWFVSMECLFNDFDYAVQESDGSERILSRCDDNSFLTKHLRVYGGTGQYDGRKIGRYLKQITFSAVGLVRKPANPNSIIFNNTNKFSGTYATSVYFINNDVQKTISSEKKTMDLEKEIADLRAALAKANDDNAELKVSASKSRANELQGELDKANKKIADLESALSAAKTSLAELTGRVESAEAAKKETEDQFMKFKKDQVKASRLSKLVHAGFDEQAAADLVESLMDVNDDYFDAFAALAAAKLGSIDDNKPVAAPTVPVQTKKNIKELVNMHINKNKNTSGVQTKTVTASASDVLEDVETVDNVNPADATASEEAAETLRKSIAAFLGE
jgi:hypothetical protein